MNTNKLDAIYCIVKQTYEPDRVHRLVNHILERLPSFPRDRIKLCAPTWGTTLSKEHCFTVYDPWLTRPGWPSLTWKNRCLIKGEISLVLNFYAVMRDAVDNGFKTVLIFESDVILRNDFEERLRKLFQVIETREWDYISLSDGIGTHADCFTGPFMEQTVGNPTNQFVFRCTDSMLFKTDIFPKIMRTIIPFRDCLDWELNFQFLVHGGKALWAEPNLIEQGSNKNVNISFLPA